MQEFTALHHLARERRRNHSLRRIVVFQATALAAVVIYQLIRAAW